VDELRPGLLWRWTAPHPQWRPGMAGSGGWERDVASVAVRTTDALVVIDPLVERWDDLDALARGTAVAVVLTAPWHARSSADVAARYGATVHVHEAGVERAAHLGRVSAFGGGEVMPGVEAVPVGGSDDGEVVLWLPAAAALVAAEVLTGAPDGLRVAESPALRSRAELEACVRALAELPAELVLPGHGPPVLRDGRREVAAALDRPRW